MGGGGGGGGGEEEEEEEEEEEINYGKKNSAYKWVVVLSESKELISTGLQH